MKSQQAKISTELNRFRLALVPSQMACISEVQIRVSISWSISYKAFSLTMTGQPLRRSPRLAAKAAKEAEAAKAHAPKCIPGILRASKAASRGASKSPVGVTFGRNAVAEFEKEDPPDELEPLSDDEAEQLFPHSCIAESLIDDHHTKRNEEILEKWDELFDDWDCSDDGSVDSDDSDGGSKHDHHKYYSGPCGNSGYVVVEEKEIDYLAIAIPDTFDCQPKKENNETPTLRVDVYFCDFCKRGVRRATKYFHE